MTPNEALGHLNKLRQSVLTVQHNGGPSPLNGADHDIYREAIGVLATAIQPKPEQEAPK